MGKDKLRRFEENLSFKNMVQPDFEEIFRKDHPMKGHWHEFFGNNNPIVLELGCGRGEYTVALAESDSTHNYIGVDIKGARMWRGAKTATEAGLTNAAFLRIRIEHITSMFAPEEVKDIWITFPDPQLKKQRAKKRLTSPIFLSNYAQILHEKGTIKLKTDSAHLYNYTNAVVEANNLELLASSNDIYGSGFADPILSIKTAYESKFLAEGIPITFTSFMLNGRTEFVDPDFEEDVENKR